MSYGRIALVLVTALVTGCSAQGMHQGIYEGARVKNLLQSPPSERFGKPELPSDYRSYDSMRGKNSY